ncbi:hypothetical protein AB0O34_18430 [Sphaerisporangium sp. NPDC088356]|uniref:hypothetical protein n=1 Tax=Sphaerisporangium sp. NPDC088356 TaxID=3154871 RepID=UPI00342C0C51
MPAGTPRRGATPSARPRELFSARYWTDLAVEAESGLLDFVTIEDSLGPQSSRYEGPDDRTDQVRGRLDAVLLAARIARTSAAASSRFYGRRTTTPPSCPGT